MTEHRPLTLWKKGHVYIFRYHAGEEDVLIQLLLDRAADKTHPLDWFDAALLSHQMGPASAAIMQEELRNRKLEAKG